MSDETPTGCGSCGYTADPDCEICAPAPPLPETPNMTDETSRIVAGLTRPQRRSIKRMTDAAIHPYDIGMNGIVVKALVTRGLAYRAVCTMTATDERFNGYGLTPLGLAVQAHLKDTTHAG